MNNKKKPNKNEVMIETVTNLPIKKEQNTQIY